LRKQNLERGYLFHLVEEPPQCGLTKREERKGGVVTGMRILLFYLLGGRGPSASAREHRRSGYRASIIRISVLYLFHLVEEVSQCGLTKRGRKARGVFLQV